MILGRCDAIFWKLEEKLVTICLGNDGGDTDHGIYVNKKMHVIGSLPYVIFRYILYRPQKMSGPGDNLSFWD